MTENPPVEPNQADRNAAADYARDNLVWHRLKRSAVRQGQKDDHRLVQAFARHRLSAIAAFVADARKYPGYRREGVGEQGEAEDGEDCCPPHCCCCGPGEPCCDCGKIMPGFTPSEIEHLNAWQSAGIVHEFTCGGEEHDGAYSRTLIPTSRGWICPGCDYTQDWAHDHMKDGSGLAGQQAALSSLLAPAQPSEADAGLAGERDAICRIIESFGRVRIDAFTGLALGSDVETLADRILAALRRTPTAATPAPDPLQPGEDAREKLRSIINERVCRFVGEYEDDREELIKAILAAASLRARASQGSNDHE